MTAEKDMFSVKEYGVLVEQGKAAYKAGRFPEAVKAWRKAQAVDPSRRAELEGYLDKAVQKQTVLHLANAKKYESMGDQEKAAGQYHLILQLEPKDQGLKAEVLDKLQSFEKRDGILSAGVVAALVGAFLVLVLIALLLILRMD